MSHFHICKSHTERLLSRWLLHNTMLFYSIPIFSWHGMFYDPPSGFKLCSYADRINRWPQNKSNLSVAFQSWMKVLPIFRSTCQQNVSGCELLMGRRDECWLFDLCIKSLRSVRWLFGRCYLLSLSLFFLEEAFCCEPWLATTSNQMRSLSVQK